MRHNNNTIIQAGNYLELLYYTTLIFNIANIAISLLVLPIAVTPIILVSTIAIIPLFVLMIRNLLPAPAVESATPQEKTRLQRAAEKFVHWYSENIAKHWLSKLLWDIILAFGVSSSLYSVFTYFDISLGIHKLSLFSQLSMIGGGLFLLTQIANYFMKDITDPNTKKVSRTIEVINQSLIFALTSIVTVGSLYAQVYLYGVNALLLSIFVAITATISVYCTLAKQEQAEANRKDGFTPVAQEDKTPTDDPEPTTTHDPLTKPVKAASLTTESDAIRTTPDLDTTEDDEDLYLAMQQLFSSNNAP